MASAYLLYPVDMRHWLALSIFVLAAAPLFSADRSDGRYIVVLQDPALAEKFPSRSELHSAAAAGHRKKIEAAQQTVRREIEKRNIRVLSSVETVLNAIFVQATPEQAAEIRKLPGVKRVEPARRLKRQLDKAAQLINAPAAWSAAGGPGNAGAGIKIAILDTGIDITQPGMQDASLAVPAGFPKCQPQDCAYTNNKVIVARSYVQVLAAGTQRPDDLSPRDRTGHGTAVAMIAAGAQNSAPAATITGIAPKAFLGNYKIFGSPGVNDFTFSDVVIQGLNDAVLDGMDVVNLSIGGQSAFYGPLDKGVNVCGDANACDAMASAVETVARAGLAVVVSAGDDGSNGAYYPALNSINTPGTAPSAITVGASTNSHVFVSSIAVNGGGVPSSLQQIVAAFGDGPKPATPLTAPAVDVTSLGNDGFGCASLGSLNGAIALMQRGNCFYETKVLNATNAGAVGVIVYQPSGTTSLDKPVGLTATSIPLVSITNASGVALKSFLQSNPGRSITLDATLQPATITANVVAAFSSEGPSIGTYGIKPELVAPGSEIYTATQNYDPNSDMYNPTGYGSFQGTSFAAAMATGAVALVKQKNPTFNAGQLKSAVVNTTTQDVTDYYGTASVVGVGAGKLNVNSALQSNITVEPATLSYGVVTSGSLPKNIALKITNVSSGHLNLTLKFVQRVSDSRGRLSLSASTLSLNSGQSATVTATLGGNTPNPGIYEGFLNIQGGAVTLNVPYLYLGTDQNPANIFALAGDSFTGVAGQNGPLLVFKVVDQFGLPVQGLPVQWGTTYANGRIVAADSYTDLNGTAAAQTVIGTQLGEQEFAAQAYGGGLTVYFDGIAIQGPAISSNGVVNAASGQTGNGLAPGSYISIFGSALSPIAKVESTTYLPVSLAGVSVGFDDQASGLSVPGHIAFVSPGQVNVQIPWECQGLKSVQMKVSIGDTASGLYTVPLASSSPAAFEYTDSSSGQRFAAVLDENYGLVGSNNPARRGRPVQVFANGLGPVDNQPASGEASPVSPLAKLSTPPTVTIGGLPAIVQFAGLTPNSVGLYQLNVVVPDGLPADSEPLVMTANGVASKAVNIPLQ